MKKRLLSQKPSYAGFSATRIIVIYIVVGGLWILLSDKILAVLITDVRTLTYLQTFKGWFFIIITAVLLYLLINRSFTTIRGSQQALLKSERTLMTLLSNLPGMAYRCRNDPAWTMEFVSEGCYALTGYSPSELINNSKITYADLIHPDDREMVWQEVQNALEQNMPFRIVYRIIGADRQERWVWEQGRSTPSQNGTIEFLEGFITDITERKEAEQELQEHREHLEEMVKQRTLDLQAAQKALVQKEKLKTLGAISAEVAHEIRNPLFVIGGFAKRLQKKYPDLSETEIILDESKRLEKILKRIKDYLKPVEMRPQECSPNEVIEDCLDLLSGEMERENVVWQLDLSPDLSSAYVDPGILAEVLINVIKNSIKLMDKEVSLHIKTHETDQSILIDCRIPVVKRKIKDPEMLLLPFDEVSQNVGLPLSYRLLKDMGGLLSYSQEGQRAIFSISLLKTMRAEHLESSQETEPLFEP